MIRYTLDLYNNFEWFTPNGENYVPQVPCGNVIPPNVGGQAGCSPIFGDQFHQRDDRIYAGGSASRTYKYVYAGLPTETTFGIQTRYDAISLGLTDTAQRTFIANIRTDKVGEGSIGIYGENTIHWTNWFRTTLGWRGDYFEGTDTSIYDPFNSGHTQAAIGSPKASMVIGPFNKTEFFLGAGMGLHSNDVRGTTITEYPVDRLADPVDHIVAHRPVPAARAHPRRRGRRAHQGGPGPRFLRQPVLPRPGLRAGVRGRRRGHRGGPPFRTLRRRVHQRLPPDLLAPFRRESRALPRAVHRLRFRSGDDSISRWPAIRRPRSAMLPGNYIPNAPWLIASAGVTLGEKTGWFGALRWRYLGTAPLTEDNAFRSSPESIFNGRLGYAFDNGWKVQLDALNLFDAKANQIMYAYGSLLKSDPLYAQCNSATPPPVAVCQTGVMDSVLHPIEPLAVRLSLTGVF